MNKGARKAVQNIASTAIRREADKWGLSLQEAARVVKELYPTLCRNVVEELGPLPSPETELVALQSVWA